MYINVITWTCTTKREMCLCHCESDHRMKDLPQQKAFTGQASQHKGHIHRADRPPIASLSDIGPSMSNSHPHDCNSLSAISDKSPVATRVIQKSTTAHVVTDETHSCWSRWGEPVPSDVHSENIYLSLSENRCAQSSHAGRNHHHMGPIVLCFWTFFLHSSQNPTWKLLCQGSTCFCLTRFLSLKPETKLNRNQKCDGVWKSQGKCGETPQICFSTRDKSPLNGNNLEITSSTSL